MNATTFSDTLSLGWLLATIVIAILGGVFAIRDRSVKRWRGLYELADAERKEVQQSLDECTDQLAEARQVISEQREIIAKLDALQMPIRIVELMNASVERIDAMADQRLRMGIQQLTEYFDEKLELMRHPPHEDIT
jgi:F0F1-type ATP synthase membrane subunit b/b'